MHLNQSDKSHH